MNRWYQKYDYSKDKVFEILNNMKLDFYLKK